MEILTEMLMYEDVLTLPVAMLSTRSLHSATILCSYSYYTVITSIFLASTASCKAVCGIAPVRTSEFSTRVCTRPYLQCTGKGSQHFH